MREEANQLRTLSTGEVASALGCNETTVRFLEDSKQLPHFWVSGRRRVREPDLIAFMQAGGQKFSQSAYKRNPGKYSA